MKRNGEMKMKKRILCALLCVLMLLPMVLMTGCNSGGKDGYDSDAAAAERLAERYIEYVYIDNNRSSAVSLFYPRALSEIGFTESEVELVLAKAFSTMDEVVSSNASEVSSSEIDSYLNDFGYSFDIEKAYLVSVRLESETSYGYIEQFVAKIDGSWYVMPRLDGDLVVFAGNLDD